MWALLTTFSWSEVARHPWRNAAAVSSVMLGVALAFSVQLINASALDEFSRGMRSVGGQPDLEVRSVIGGASLPESVLSSLWSRNEIESASPVLEMSGYALNRQSPGTAPPGRTLLRIVGIDAIQIADIAPDLLPQPLPGRSAGTIRESFFSSESLFLNAAAMDVLGDNTVWLQRGLEYVPLNTAGVVRASGGPLAVMDIAALQALWGTPGKITRVDLRLRPGVDPQAFIDAFQSLPEWPAGVVVQPPGDPAQRMGNLSQAYRVNLSVLALIALFTGGFLVFSVLALSVTRRSQQFALLGVLGLTGTQRMQLVLMEASVLGLAGSVAGIALGTGLAALGLKVLGGDLGGGYFSAASPALQWSAGVAIAYGALGILAALAGAWWPARMAQRLPPAQTLKGLGMHGESGRPNSAGLILLFAGALLALLPPVAGIPLAAYLSVALILTGGIIALPWLVGTVLDRVSVWSQGSVLAMLAIERARRGRHIAAIAVSGVVASLSLSVALTVMVGSFRESVSSWLDSMLPADLYVRTASSNSANESAYFDSGFLAAAGKVDGIRQIALQRTLPLHLSPSRPPVTLIARELKNPETGNISLPLLNEALKVPEGRVPIYVSEAVVDLYGVRPGQDFPLLATHLEWKANASSGTGKSRSNERGGSPLFVAGVWRDYARQFGTVAMASQDLARWLPDAKVTDMALWLKPGADIQQIQQKLQSAAGGGQGPAAGLPASLLEFGSTRQIRDTTLRIFDRSFAVTYWLQSVAIGIGLFGVAASFSAQVLARRKEFGLLVHLGLTRRQILQLVAAEGFAWTSLGALAGVVLGLAVAVVLVYVVNPQSFHWTMEMSLSWWRLAALALSVVAAGTLTAWIAARSAADHDVVLAVKEDW